MSAPANVFRHRVESAGIWVNGYDDNGDTAIQLTRHGDRSSNSEYLSPDEAREYAAALIAAADAVESATAVAS